MHVHDVLGGLAQLFNVILHRVNFALHFGREQIVQKFVLCDYGQFPEFLLVDLGLFTRHAYFAFGLR